MKEQKRGRKIAMTPEELDAFLAEERTCRVATVGADGAPHNTALWYAWDGTSFWLTSIVKSQRWTDLMRDGRVSVLVDGGVEYFELRGAEIRGTAVPVGEVPRTGEPAPELENVERIYAARYGRGEMHHDGRHAWLRITPEKIVSWDFRKLGG